MALDYNQIRQELAEAEAAAKAVLADLQSAESEVRDVTKEYNTATQKYQALRTILRGAGEPYVMEDT